MCIRCIKIKKIKKIVTLSRISVTRHFEKPLFTLEYCYPEGLAQIVDSSEEQIEAAKFAREEQVGESKQHSKKE